MIDIDGHIRLTDFGISKKGLSKTDRTNSFCGSPEYMVKNTIFNKNIIMIYFTIYYNKGS